MMTPRQTINISIADGPRSQTVMKAAAALAKETIEYNAELRKEITD